MKFYLAARYQKLEEINKYAQQLRELGHEVTSRWLLGTHQLHAGAEKIDTWHGYQEDTPLEARPFAQDDIEDIEKATAIISFTEKPFSDKGRGGRHVEFGYALARNKMIFIIGVRENVFHCLPQVMQYATWEDFIKVLGGI